jgi:acetylornithine/N-succinyldiaminopimelate aminotransferase
MNQRQLFLQHLAPTSFEPMALPIARAKGHLLYDTSDKAYIDLIGGISVCNVGHCHPKVVNAIQAQAEQYLHVMVYGEVIQSPQVQYATLLARHLPDSLNAIYFTNSGAEAVEGAMKLAKRCTGRFEIIACNNSYHGSTQGALSLLGDEYWRNAYRPLLPGIRHVRHNDFASLELISMATAAILLEPIQAEGGVLVPDITWMQALRQKCNETGTLLMLDEIQTGFGRTGTLWAFEQLGIVPDILLLGKALGGGMPLGAFIASKHLMDQLAHNPILGHITTFGGHPVSCAAGMAAMHALLDENMISSVQDKSNLFAQQLNHPAIRAIRRKGLMIALQLKDFETVKKVIAYCLSQESTGVFTDWFLFASDCIRIVPPLTITNESIEQACAILLRAIDSV